MTLAGQDGISKMTILAGWHLKEENRRVRDADGDTAGSSPNSSAQNYRSGVPLSA